MACEALLKMESKFAVRWRNFSKVHLLTALFSTVYNNSSLVLRPYQLSATIFNLRGKHVTLSSLLFLGDHPLAFVACSSRFEHLH